MASGQNKNFYQLLGVERTASTEQIKEAYKELAKVYHPDSHFYDEIVGNTSDPIAAEKYKIITQAYTTLSNPVLRAEYDQGLGQELYDWDVEVVNSRSLSSKFRANKSNTHFGNIQKRTATYSSVGPSVAELMKKKGMGSNTPVVISLAIGIIIILVAVVLTFFTRS